MQRNDHITQLDLVARCLKNDRRAQKELYVMYFSTMMNTCMRYTRDKEQALEVLNDAFLKVFTELKKFKGEGSLEGWIRKIVFHTSIDHVRKNTSYKKSIELDVEVDHEINEEALSNLTSEELLQVIDTLVPATKNVFVLYTIEGYNHKEISQLLNISEGTSKWHLSNARKQLQEKLKKTGEYLLAI